MTELKKLIIWYADDVGFYFTEPTAFEIKGRGYAYAANLFLNPYSRKATIPSHELSEKLRATTIQGQQIRGVEMFAVLNQNDGVAISILVEKPLNMEGLM